MNNEQFIVLGKEMITNYYKAEGVEIKDEIKVSLIETSIVAQNRKGLFAANVNENHLFEVTVVLNDNKAYLGVYHFEKGMTFDISFKPKEEK